MTFYIQLWKSDLNCRPVNKKITVFKNIILNSWALLLSITTLIMRYLKQPLFKASLMKSDH